MRPKSSRRHRTAHRTTALIGALEPRMLMAATTIAASAQEAVINTIPAFASTNTQYTSIPLDSYFQDPNVPGTLVTFETSKGNILVSLTDTATPLEVANFLSYVTSGAYNGTIFHRDANIATGADGTTAGSGFNSSNPATIIQGGGYSLQSGGLTHIATTGTVNDEYTTEAYDNITGTIAGAKTSAANSTGSEWYFNVSDNSGLDGPQNVTDSSGNVTGTTGYTVFGKVLSGMNVITSIASLPTAAVNTADGSTTPAPITGLTQTQISDGAGIGSNNLVYVYDVVQQAGTTYAVTSTDTGLVTPTVTDGKLTFHYGSGRTGTAIVTVTATNAYDATTATQTFAVTVPSTTATTAAPITAADTATANSATAANATTGAAALNGPATVIHPLTNDTVGSGDFTTATDGAGNLLPAALNPASVTIVTQPTHGTASVDATTGDITYVATPNTDGSVFTGTDTLTYTVADTAGNVSAATTVNVNVIPAPQTISIGSGSKVKAIVYTQPDGSRARFTVTGAAAAVTFSAGALSVTTKGSTDTISGAGATIASVDLSNTAKAGPIVSLTGIGKGAITLGDVTDKDRISQLIALNATLAGTVSATSIKRINVAAMDGADITAHTDSVATVATIGTAVNTSMNLSAITSLTSRSWTITDQGSHVVQADVVGTLSVSGAFADALTISSSSGFSITTANVTGASGEWDIAGPIRKATLTKPTSAFALDDQSVVETLRVNGDLTGNVIAAVIDDMVVTGAMSGASIQTDALFNAADTQLAKLTVGGAITNSVIASAGNIGTITAKSLNASRVYAGANSTTIGNYALPTGTSDLTSTATIKSVALSAGKNTFGSSEIAAYTIKRVALGKVTVDNGGTGFGVSAHELDGLTANLNPGGGLSLTHAQTKTAATLAAYIAKHKKTLKDFIVQIF